MLIFDITHRNYKILETYGKVCRPSLFCGKMHCVKYRNFTEFLGLEILPKGTVSVEFLANRKTYTLRNEANLGYFTQ